MNYNQALAYFRNFDTTPYRDSELDQAISKAIDALSKYVSMSKFKGVFNMPKGFIYDENGDLEEVLDCSCDGFSVRFCPHCQKDTTHYLVALSNIRGEVWSCYDCGLES